MNSERYCLVNFNDFNDNFFPVLHDLKQNLISDVNKSGLKLKLFLTDIFRGHFSNKGLLSYLLSISIPAGAYLLKVNNKDPRTTAVTVNT